MFKLPFKSKPPPRRTERGEQRRLALLKMAQEVFLERGYEGTSIEEIMARVGGSKASLYSYFGSKEGLFFEIMIAQTDVFMNELKLPEVADEHPEKTLRRIGISFLKAILDERRRGLFRIMIAEAARLPQELVQRFYDFGPQRGRKALADYLKLQHKARRLRVANNEQAAAQFFELIKGQPHSRALLGLTPFTSGNTLERHVDSAVNLFLRGYLPRG